MTLIYVYLIIISLLSDQSSQVIRSLNSLNFKPFLQLISINRIKSKSEYLPSVPIRELCVVLWLVLGIDYPLLWPLGTSNNHDSFGHFMKIPIPYHYKLPRLITSISPPPQKNEKEQESLRRAPFKFSPM